MKVFVYTNCFAESYLGNLSYLEKEGKIDLKIIDSRFFYLLILKLYNSFSILRALRGLISGNSQKYDFNPKFRDIILSFFAPLILLFTRSRIILFFPPYDSMIFYMYFLKLIGKKIIYFTSWPYWDGIKYVRKKTKLRLFFWNRFLKGIKAVTVTEYAANNLRKFGASVIVIPHGIDTSYFVPGKKREKIICTLARMIEPKGIHALLEYCKNLPKGWRFYFVGHDGPLRKEVENFGNENVKYFPYSKERALSVCQNSSIFVLNSYAIKDWEELFGMVLIEAMSCKLPVISTDCIGPKEILADCKGGLLIQQNNLNDLKKKINMLIKNPALRDKLGKQGREKALKYDTKVLSEKWLEVLKNV